MPWSPTQSGNMNPANFFANCVTLNSAGTAQSISGTGSGIFIPFASLESYKVATSGDVRELVYSIVDKVASVISGLAVADRPSKLSISKSVSASETSAVKTFSVSVNLNSASTVYDVQDE